MFGTVYGEDHRIGRRREAGFIVLAGVFLGTLALLNILGISRQIDLSFTLGTVTIPFVVFVGVLPGRALWLRNNGSTLTSGLILKKVTPNGNLKNEIDYI